MQDYDEIETEKSLLNLNKICRFLSFLMKVFFALFCVGWLLAFSLNVASLVNPDLFGAKETAGVLGPILCFAYGVIVVPMFLALIGMFTDVAKGNSPFTLAQTKRLRVISGMLVLYFLVDFAIAFNSAMLQLDALNSGYFSTNSSAILTLNFAPLIVAAVVFAFSFVFKYGVLLQEFSDDTV
ncbi:hypothetical protein [Gordonibacter sp.]|uniref:hypothetical protein n=1 Tax=Gordonibacter sp. TaxID=1968902 RepID=UPI002FC6899F